MKTPVVMIVFNRPELTRRVFERVRAAQPRRLLVVCDGPRSNRPMDAERVPEVRDIFEKGIDWPCELIREYAPQNLGCMDRIHTGLDRAFEIFDDAIILEDDCLPDPSFFPFCEEMLTRYRDNDRVMNISGTSLIANRYKPGSDSYWFSHHPWIWGWATWQRAWRHYDFTMEKWNERQKPLRASFASNWERQFWISAFEQARRNFRAVNTWDYQWNFTCRSRDGVSIVPRNNLIENLGFGADSTHTNSDMSRLVVPTQSLDFPLQHPSSISVSRYADDLHTRVYAGQPINVLENAKARLRLLAEKKTD